MWFTLASMFVGLTLAMLLFQRFLSGESWGSALFFSLVYASVFVLLWGWGESRRRRRRRHVAGITSLERGVVTAKDGRRLTVRGDEREVSWRAEAALGIGEGDSVWAAPRIAPGERIVLVRATPTHGLLQDVLGPRTEAVAANAATPHQPSADPPPPTDGTERGHTP
ncbi:hypothetical protein AVL62_04840 [Serinicoccus chungangensis]|uniref:Uncharacterized protein n=2 Tax=Serinicoccus chungangensis TaxID=767452 RepID=A0A0W8I8B2_9MICO|nr:hypothetical protein AVL62_04840 [Serinicoccus chungangensis]